MKYVIWYHGPNEPERVTVHDPHTGMKLGPDQARLMLLDALGKLPLTHREEMRERAGLPFMLDPQPPKSTVIGRG